MIKYFGEILSKFSRAQRLTALFALIFLVITLTLGGRVISSLGYDDRELRKVIQFQKTELESLRNELQNSNQLMLENQRSCTRNALQREQEIIKEIEDLENAFRALSQRKYNHLEKVTSDSVRVQRMVIVEDPSTEIMMKGLQNLKKKVKH